MPTKIDRGKGRVQGKRQTRPGEKKYRPGSRPARPSDDAATPSSRDATPALAGLAARRLAVQLIEAVLVSRHALDDALATADRNPEFQQLETRDRGFARLIAATVLRRLGSIDAVLARFLERPMPIAAVRPRSILRSGVAQILLIGTPVHAAINLAVEQCRRDAKANRFDKLTNAVLRRVANEGPELLSGLDWPRCDIPDWLWQSWVSTYGEATAGRIASASLAEAPLDLSVKADAAQWAERLGGDLLLTGSVRINEAGRIEDLPGYSEGVWWVQDAAAALPVRLLEDVGGLEIADICAAPGGKTAELAASGAKVTAVDQSAERLQRLAGNVERLGLSDAVGIVTADAASWQPGRTFDAVLLDVPCLSTGTIRRHPDLLHLKRPSDLGKIVELQRSLIENAARLVRPGGRLVYCVCSLQREEGEGVVEAFLASHAEFQRDPVTAGQLFDRAEWITPAGDLRTLPFQDPGVGRSHGSPGDTVRTGMDGFYGARLVRKA